jgi:RNA polymerase subunit RPABC4/transcription elongation factor Spt4
MSEWYRCPDCGRIIRDTSGRCPYCDGLRDHEEPDARGFEAVVDSSMERVEQVYGEHALRRLCAMQDVLEKIESELDAFMRSASSR